MGLAQVDSSVDLIFNLLENDYMLKILLVYDDFQELTSVELILKKIGFDVVGITSEFSLAEQLLSFNPQVVVAQGRTAKVSTLNVGRRLRETIRWDGKSVLVFYSNAKPQATELLKIRMDVGLEYPLEPTKLIQVLAQLGNLDANQLLDKLIKSMAQDVDGDTDVEATTAYSMKADNDAVFVSGGAPVSEDEYKMRRDSLQDNAKMQIGGSDGTMGSGSTGVTGNGVGGAAGEFARSITGGATAAEIANNITGGLENSFEQNKLKGSRVNSELNREVRGGSQEEGNGPRFPLNGLTAEMESVNDSGSKSTLNENRGPNNQFELNAQEMERLTQDPLMQELESLLKKKSDLSLAPPIQDPARRKKYDEYVKTIPIHQLASIKRTQAKTRLRDLIKDVDKPILQDQDVLRREYVKALFKKEG